MEFFRHRLVFGLLAAALSASLSLPAVTAAPKEPAKKRAQSSKQVKKEEKPSDKTTGVAPSSNVPRFAPGTGGEDDFTSNQGSEQDDAALKNQGVAAAPDYEPSPDKEGRMEVDEALLKQTRTDAASEASVSTRKNARTMALLIPPPRGQIVDRNGLPLAQNVICYQLVLKYGQFEDEDKDRIVAYGRRCLEDAKKLAGSAHEISDQRLWSHYQHRRWLPLPLTDVLTDEEVKKLKTPLPPGVELLPIYKRVYPEGKSSAHWLGYMGSKGRLPVGPINNMDPLWEVSEGKSGFEKKFDNALTGRPGVWRLMFDEQGNKILDELSIKPKPGGTLVTTINLKWQKVAEKILSERCKRGAFVVIDVHTGEVLVLASQPSFDPNRFAQDYEKLHKDKDVPLVSRAYRGSYPPASTYKTVVALAALANGAITKDTIIYCPSEIAKGGHVFRNWTKVPEGNINVCRALARSTNTFFFQVSDKLKGPGPFLSMSRRLGMGQRTGLPIDDLPGLIPDDKWLQRNNRTRFYDGDGYNYSIGQGVIEATPLQVAQFMTGIASGVALPKLHMIKQIQDMDGNVIYAANREVRNSLADVAPSAAIVRKGMYDVVNGGGGTGGRAKLSYTDLCGKTGTGQYGSVKDDKRVGWFAGFLPYDQPRYAFVALYEGAPREKVGGSANAAPMVKEFFETLKKDVKDAIQPVLAEIVDEDEPGEKTSPRPADSTTPSDTPHNGEAVPGPATGPQPDAADQVPVLPEIEEINDSSESGGGNAQAVPVDEAAAPEASPESGGEPDVEAPAPEPQAAGAEILDE